MKKKLHVAPHSKTLIAETTDGLAFVTAINKYSSRMASFLLWFKVLFGVFGGLQMLLGLAWFDLGPQQASELKRNIPFLTLLLLSPSIGFALTYITFIPAMIYTMSKNAPQCLSCQRKIKWAWDREKCLRSGACPHCGFSRNGVPIHKTNKRSCLKGCISVIMYIFGGILIFSGIPLWRCPAGLLLIALGLGIASAAGFLLAKKK